MVPIIETKLIPYQLPATYINRPRLFQWFSGQHHPQFILLTGGGGWGKSLLVASFLKVSSIEAAWVNLDHTDQNPSQFLKYISLAISKVYPKTSSHLSLPSLQSNGNEQWQPAASALINAILMLSPQPVRLVLDDFHRVEMNDQILQILKHLLVYAPPNFQIILISRHKPEIPLSRLSINRDIVEIGTAELAFSREEIYHLFHQTYGKRLNRNQLDLLSRYTDGWPISLRIFGETTAKKSEQEIEALLQNLTSTNHSVIRYFEEEVFSHLPQDIQRFLVKTACLDQFNAELCDQVLESHNSKEYINRTLKLELFLVRLDEKACWYRHHQPFHRFLKERLLTQYSPETRKSLYQNAAIYFKNQMNWQAAAHHFVKSEDLESAATCIEHVVKGYFGHTYYHSIHSWLGRFPEAFTQQRVGLRFANGWLEVAHGNYNKAYNILNLILNSAKGEGFEQIMGRVVDFQMIVCSLINKDDEAIKLYETYNQAITAESTYLLRCKTRLAVSLLKTGQLARATACWKSLESETPDMDRQFFKEFQAIKGLHYYFPKGRLEEAIQHMEEGLQHYKNNANLQWQCELTIHLYFANYQMGRRSESRKWLDELLDIRNRLKNHHLIEYITCVQALEALLQRDLQEAKEKINTLEPESTIPQLSALKSLLNATLACYTGEKDRFLREAEQGIDLLKQLGNDWLVPFATTGYAKLYLDHEDKPTARHLFEYSLERLKEISAWYEQARCLLHLASLEYHLNNHGRSLDYLIEALKICDEKHYLFLLTDVEAELTHELLVFALTQKLQPETMTGLLGQLHSTHAASILPLLNHHDPDCRLAAIRILSDMKAKEVEKSIAKLSNDTDLRVRQKVESAMVTFRELPPEPLRILTFGKFRVKRTNQEISSKEWRLKMSSSLFKILLYQKDHSISVERLLDIFYSDVNEKDARVRLHKAASCLRATLEPGIAPKRESAYLKVNDGFYELVLPDGSWMDTKEMETLFKKGDREEKRGEVRKALHLYKEALNYFKGDWLEEDLYEDWTQPLRTRYTEMIQEMLRRTVKLYFKLFDYDAAIGTITRLLELDQCDENAWLFLMKCHLAKGNRSSAVRTYHTCCQALQKELDITPIQEIVDLFRSIN